MEDEHQIIEKAKNSFNNALSVPAYTDMLKDDEHLKSIINSLRIKTNGSVLDLGTGTGYIAFPLAKLFPECDITGLDLANSVITENNKKAVKERLSNLHFISYDGVSFPFEHQFFNNIVTRYALHHFPNIDKTFSYLCNMVESNGQIFISDPVPDENDEERIIDKYMNVKDDGHVKFYTQNEYESLLQKHGFELDTLFYTDMHIAFPVRDDYLQITSTVNNKIQESYDIRIIDYRVHLRLKILNISFLKR